MQPEEERDDYMTQSLVSKAEERKIAMSPQFEVICAKYWQLLHQSGKTEQKWCSKSDHTQQISKENYTKLLKSIYKVLAPLYREPEIAAEVDQEWILDSAGQSQMSLQLFQKMLFRIAHQWCPSIDVDEYLDLLQKIYERIVSRRLVRGATCKVEDVLPSIQVQITQVNQDDQDADKSSVGDDEGWESCDSQEMDDDDEFNYEDREGKKYKKRKPDEKGSNAEDDEVYFTTRDPFQFSETVVFYHCNEEVGIRSSIASPTDQDFEYDVLANMENIFPLGYPTEQYMCWVKNDVNRAFQKLKEEKKQALAAMKRELFDKPGTATAGGQSTAITSNQVNVPDQDPGILEETRKMVEQPFSMFSSQFEVLVKSFALVKDSHYNSLRIMFKDSSAIIIRPEMPLPKKSKGRGKQSDDKKVKLDQLLSRRSEFGYNPALERRLNYRMATVMDPKHPSKEQKMYINVNYLVEDPVFWTAYRCDVNRIESKDKMCIKPTEEYLREEEFNPIETTFKQAKQIMLTKKFESFFTIKLQGDEEYNVERDEEVYRLENLRLKTARVKDKSGNKMLEDTHEALNDFLQMTNGPFYKLMSTEGPRTDDFYTMRSHDLITAAQASNLRILLLGMPRSGKSTLARELQTRLNVVRISPEVWIEKMFAKIKYLEENPPAEEEEEELPPVPELEEGQEAEEIVPKVKKSLFLPLEDEIQDALKAGIAPNHHQIDQMLKELIASPEAQTRGYVLDLNFTEEEQEVVQGEEGEDSKTITVSSWQNRISHNNMLDGKAFTHIVELLISEEEVLRRSKNMLASSRDGTAYSRWERKERMKPKPKSDDDEDEPEASDPDDPERPEKLIDTEMFTRPCDHDEVVKAQIQNYTSCDRPDFDKLIIRCSNSTYVKVEAAGATPTEIAFTVTSRIHPVDEATLTPVATVIEDAGDFKSLLTQGIEEPEDENLGKPLPREWSLWKSIDPVCLMNEGQVMPGLPEFACHYANNVFVFTKEENMKAFVEDPRKFLQNGPPQMPSDYRLMVCGPRGAGTHTQAQKLSELYGWRIVDFPEIVSDKMNEILQQEEKLPNNISTEGPCMICCSAQELSDFKEGKKIDSWKFLPWVLEYLGMPLKQRPPPPKSEEPEEPNQAEMDPETLKAYLKQKKKDDDAKKKKEKEEDEKIKAKEARQAAREAAREAGQDLAELGLEDSEPEIIIDDLNLDQLVPGEDEETGLVPKIGQFIMLGFPQTELHVQKLKEYGLEFDRIVFLNDTSEEEPGKDLEKRFYKKFGYDSAWDWERESAKSNATVAVLKEHINEEVVKEINCAGSIEDVFIRIRTELDPFFLLPDNPEDYRTTEGDVDVQEPPAPEDMKKDEEYVDPTIWLPKSDFGHYCPVTYVKNNWLHKGSREFESTINGKTYWFAGEAEQAEFKFNPTRFLSDIKLPLAPPPPKICIIGMKGSGVTTQIDMLAKKFKIEKSNMLDDYMKCLNAEKNNRQRSRLLARGFRPLPEVEEGEEAPIDEELAAEAEDFDIAAHERDVLRMILPSNKSLVFDGNWNGLPEDTVAQPLHELMLEGRRVPEIIIVLRCSMDSTKERCLDVVQIKAKYDKLMDDREKLMLETREKDFADKLAEVEEANKEGDDVEEGDRKKPEEIAKAIKDEMDEWRKTRTEEDEQNAEDDPDKPNYDEMIEAEVETLTNLRSKDEEFLEEFVSTLRDKNVEVIDSIVTDVSAEYVQIKILDKLKKRMQFRADLIEREQCRLLQQKEVKWHEASYSFKHSKFGFNSPLKPHTPIKTKQFTVLYRERMYFPSNDDERAQFMLEPSKYTMEVEPTPLDLTLRPQAIVLGLPNSGKTDMCKSIAEKTGMVHLQMNEIAEGFIDRDCCFSELLAKQVRKAGKQLDDIMLVDLVAKRINMKDCLQRGWLLDGFPTTRQQAHMLLQKGINPTNVFHLQLPVEKCYERSTKASTMEFGSIRTILSNRMKSQSKNFPQVAYFYQKYFNSLTTIDGQRSRWQIESWALKAIESVMQARLGFARDFFFKVKKHGFERPCIMQGMSHDRILTKQSLSQFGYFCPVTWRQDKKFVNCVHRPELCVLFQSFFYYFAGEKEKATFLNNPTTFTEKVIFSQPRNVPSFLRQHKAAEIVSQEKGLTGYCPVSLKDEDRLEKGQQLIVVNFKDTRFVFATQEKANQFFMNPSRYHQTKLPVKMPPAKDSVSLHSLQKQQDSITFMEQALGQVVTRGLREVGENRLKYPTLSVKETMLKLFAIFLKAENPANTDHMRQKYLKKMKEFIYRCEVPAELNALMIERKKKAEKNEIWPDFKEEYYNKLGSKFDQIMKEVNKERLHGFSSYIK